MYILSIKVHDWTHVPLGKEPISRSENLMTIVVDSIPHHTVSVINDVIQSWILKVQHLFMKGLGKYSLVLESEIKESYMDGECEILNKIMKYLVI